ncbi:MAG TPA: hypothetical protein VF713_05125 [Thermoanaerobaculia bacterium]
MKRFLLCVSLAVSTNLMAAVPMARFARVIDSRTIVVQRIDATEVVHLANVNVPAEDEQAARAYLQETLAGMYVYVENGNVYRSPDALFINRELAFGAYSAPTLKMRVLGEINPGPRPQTKQAVPIREPMQVPKPHRASRKR